LIARWKRHKKRIDVALFAKPEKRRHTDAMHLNLDDAALFVRVAELGTLSAAARERNEPVSQISRAIARMEMALGARLLHRTTHGLSLTDEGDTFLAHGKRLLDTAAELESELTGKLAGPSGWVRVSVSPILAQTLVVPGLRGLYALYPQLQIDVCADDRAVDLARDGIDVAIRGGVDISDTLVARQIGAHGRSLYASPAYLREFGVPQHPDDLASHRLIANSASPSLNRWPFKKTGAHDMKSTTIAAHKKKRPGNDVDILQVKGHTRADNTSIVMSLALEGVGIARLNDLLVHPLVLRGQLEPVLADYSAAERIPIYAVMLKERHRLPKVRACIDYWAASFAKINDDAQ
jgi:DNA-binding transcriptional LysR family regulator